MDMLEIIVVYFDPLFKTSLERTKRKQAQLLGLLIDQLIENDRKLWMKIGDVII